MSATLLDPVNGSRMSAPPVFALFRNALNSRQKQVTRASARGSVKSLKLIEGASMTNTSWT